MDNSIKLIGIALAAVGLTSCGVYDDREYIAYGSGYPVEIYSNYSESRYQENYYSNYKADYRPSQTVVVPESYHVGQYHSPQSSKDSDHSWVSGQNPQGYTIELADDEQAASVAKQLYTAPKTDRRAQVKYYQNGKTHYKGVYGTYENAEAAQKAMEALPPELRKKAGIKKWGSVQNSLGE